jgi:hypothetical protein
MLERKNKEGFETKIFSLGISKDHDADLLNFLANAGSD